ncbi:kinase-like domain-containing protein [Rhizophagus clarus]|uniref:Kinase-like domain-containing protein n=1 Tax=Rhizophagus clarus TaxID=94130 RepID=A0A8H3LTL9_9GLOM|nr:kinase-like domain-containing protein [Rhizophagus clarus]
MTPNNTNSKRSQICQDVLSFGEDLLRLIPTPFATEIRDSLLKIVDLVKSAKENEKYCDDLLNRLACATETISMVLKHAPAGYKIGPKNLDRYSRILLNILSWIEHFSESKMTRKILNILTAEKVAKEISELKQDLDSVVIDMTYHIVATNRDHSINTTIDQSELEILALLSGSEPSEALISRTCIDDNDIRPDTKNVQIRGSRKHVIKKFFRQDPVAEKSILPFEGQDKQHFWKGVAIAEYLRNSPYIAKFRGVSLKNGCLYTYYDWAENGDLYSFLKDEKHSNLDRNIKIRLSYEISCALSYCHSKNILHHSIKGHNILLDEFLRPLLSNFQESRPLTTRPDLTFLNDIITSGQNENVRWTAPEKVLKTVGTDGHLISKDVRYTKECDVFSFGMLMYEIASQSLPFSFETELTRVREYIISGKRPSFETLGMPTEYREIAEQAWDHDPNKRPTMQQITDVLYNLYSDIPQSDFFIPPRGPRIKSLDIKEAKELHEKAKFLDAFKIFQELAQSGNNEAKYFMGYYWYKGEKYTGNSKNLDCALTYLLPIAESGHTDAQYYTAVIYYEKYLEYEGNVNAIVESYIELHKQFLDMAVKQNHLNAIYLYGKHCYTGKIYEKNMTIGTNMLLAAHYLGHPDADETLKELQIKELQINDI